MADEYTLTVGEAAPNFTVLDQDEQPFELQKARGEWIVLYFYPKDNTSGCTVEAQEFTALKGDFEAAGARILGLSPDSSRVHRGFIEKKELGIQLLSDPDKEVLQSYCAWRLKKNYGREYYGVARSTVIIDPEGIVRKVWKSVKARGHAEKVLKALRSLQS